MAEWNPRDWDSGFEPEPVHGFNVRITCAAEPVWPYARAAATTIINITLSPNDPVPAWEIPRDYPHIVLIEIEAVEA